MKEFIIFTVFILQLAGIILGVNIFDDCKKVTSPIDVWNEQTRTKVERLVLKPLLLLMSPSIYLGGIIAQPSICNKEKENL